MADGARSDHPALQRELDRLNNFSPGSDTLGLERIKQLLAKLGNPHKRLPPVFHMAGTNGKGSSCAYLRACLEAAGYHVHVYSSPHLVRFNERIRIKGALISDEDLAALLHEVLNANGDDQISFFEATTAAAFLAFSRTKADATIIEVGLGGRLDATNVIEQPTICGVAQLGIDHQAFLGNTLEVIAREKLGIAKTGTPIILSRYADEINSIARDCAHNVGATPLSRGQEWDVAAHENGLLYSDSQGTLLLPTPALIGTHQSDNAALATAMLRHQSQLRLTDQNIQDGIRQATWPARMQKLREGPLHALLPKGSQLWLDGGHNEAAAHAVSAALRQLMSNGQPVAMVLGMLSNKPLESFLRPFAGLVSHVYGVPIANHAHHSAKAIAAQAQALHMHGVSADHPAEALRQIAQANTGHSPLVLIAGSLYLAGEVLRGNAEIPA